MRRLTAALVGIVFLLPLKANPDPLPIQFGDDIESIASTGGGGCGTGGGYNADTFEYEQTHLCDLEDISGTSGGGWGFPILDQRTYLDALINNDGEILGGTFNWYGIIPELGIDELTLLATGTLIKISYFIGDEAQFSQNQYAPGVSTLIQFDSPVSFGPGINLGRFVEWYTYTDLYSPDCTSSVTCPLGSRSFDLPPNWTGTSFAYFRIVAIPEPSTLALFAIGLAGIGLTRRRKKA